jgi:sucrose synthase
MWLPEQAGESIMTETLEQVLEQNKETGYLLFRYYLAQEKPFLLRSELWDHWVAFCSERKLASDLASSPLARLVHNAQEAVISAPWVYLQLRPFVARTKYLRVHIDELETEEVSASHYLQFKESVAKGQEWSSDWALEFDIGPFNREFPKLRESRSIGRGVEFLNRRLSSQLFQELGRGDQGLLQFLSMHQYEGQQLMIDSRINDVSRTMPTGTWWGVSCKTWGLSPAGAVTWRACARPCACCWTSSRRRSPAPWSSFSAASP